MGENDLAGLAIIMTVPVAAIIGGIWLSARKAALRARASSGDQQEMQGLWDTARRMEARIGYLETVLDTEVPGWRSRSEAR